MVDIEEGSLCAFKQNVFAGAEQLIHNNAGIGNVRTQLFCISQIFLQYSIIGKRFCTVNFGDNSIFCFQINLQLISKGFGLHQIADTDAYASNLIHVAGTDAAFGGADFVIAQCFLLQLIKTLMIRQNNVCTVRNNQIAAINALFLHAGDFSQHNAGVDYNAVAQNVSLIIEQYAGWQQTQLIINVVNYNGMTCIGTAAVTNYSVSLLRQIVNNFTFTLIAPLGT